MARGKGASLEARQRETLGLGQSIDLAATSLASCYFSQSLAPAKEARPGQPGTCFC